MKRLSRRLAALLMAMVMVLAMGVTSFAQETSNKNVNVHFVPEMLRWLIRKTVIS